MDERPHPGGSGGEAPGVDETTAWAGEDDAFEAQARFARVMGHPVRLKILHLLHESARPMASQELLDHLGIPKAGLSQHLSRMAAVGLVRTQRKGRQLFATLAHPEIGVACDMVRRVLARQVRERSEALGDVPPPAG